MRNKQAINFVEGLRIKDESVFDKLVSTYRKKLHSKALGILGREEDAEDAVQQTFISAWKTEFLPEPRKFVSWLFTVLKNECYIIIRKHQSSRLVFSEEVVSFAVDTACLSKKMISKDLANKYYGIFSADTKHLIYLNDSGLSFSEIGNILGKKTSTVKVQVHREKCRKREQIEMMSCLVA